VLTAALVVAGLPCSLSAQAVPALGGAEVRVGLTVPQHAHVAPIVFGEVDAGYLWQPSLRVLVGLSLYEANIDREGGGNEGFFRAGGLWLSGRYDLTPVRTVSPYARLGLTLQRVDVDAFDRDVDALLGGTYVGAAAGLGARYALDGQGRLSATAELRRTFITNVGNTALELGVRFQRRGLRAYDPEWRPVAWPDRVPTPAPGAPTPAAQPPAAADTAADRYVAELQRLAVEAEEAVAAARAAAAVEPDPVREELVAPVRADPAALVAMLRQGLSRAAGAMESLVGLRETEDHFVVTLGGGAFPTGAASLVGPARGEVRVLATVLAGYPGHVVSVEGHTDSVGDAGQNQRLSEQRALSVRAALIAEGVDPLWVGSRGFGAQRPVASNQTAEGRAANRRVEVRVSKAPCPGPPLPGADGLLECRW
jgi:outer membrane protein OmpA-like peptidoglycan-associated protein